MNAVVVITGATKGLGRALSIAFAERSYKLIGIYRADTEAAQQLENEFNVHHWPLKLICADVSSDCEFLRAEAWIVQAESMILINNVGPVFEPRPMHLFKWSDYQEMFNSTMCGAVQCTLGLLPIMLKKKGCTIVNVASAAASCPPKGFSAYAAAKSALITFSKSLGVEYGDRGLRVVTVSPGFMLTPATEAWHPMLRDSISSSQGGALDLRAVADRIAAIVQDDEIPARGEEYTIMNGSCLTLST
jgi:3-oxoacyl-[acyl-carrier protein] reductase